MSLTITNKITGIILAAGEAKRFGEPKQLLPWKNTTILGNVVKEFKKSKLDNIIVVLGAYEDRIKKKLSQELKDVEIAVNKHWKEGMFSSILCGLKKAIEIETDYALFHQGDMPFINYEIIDIFIEKSKNSPLLILGTVNNRPAHPYMIKNILFNEIMNMDGSNGMRPFIKKYIEKAVKVEVTYKIGKQDIDTWEDYRRLKNGI